MSKGRVSWYSDSLGYGFIETQRGDRVLVRESALDADEPSRSIQEGQIVEFKVRSRDDGVIEASAVTPVAPR